MTPIDDPSFNKLSLLRGSLVSIRSTSSQCDDWLDGVIVVLSEEDLIVRLHTGPRIRVPYSQIRDQRLVIQ